MKKITTMVTIITAILATTNFACAHKAEPPTFKTTGYKKISYTKKKTTKKSSKNQMKRKEKNKIHNGGSKSMGDG